jgi:hypothetical protein
MSSHPGIFLSPADLRLASFAEAGSLKDGFIVIYPPIGCFV